MNQNRDRSSDKDPANSSTEEMDALRKRLAALEQSVPGCCANQRRLRKVKSRTIVIGLNLVTLAVVWMVLDRPSVVHSQSSVTDPFTIDRNGNVGIRTTTPSATLDVNGDLKARTANINGDLSAASLRFPDGTTQATAAPPAGAVIAFDLSACPAGWTEYAQARGRFIRGIDRSGQNIDPDGQRSLGGTQEDAIQNITGSISGVAGANNKAWDWGFRPGTSGAFNVPMTLDQYNCCGSGVYKPTGGIGSTANFDASRVVRTATENRPKNVALLYCRKN
jgi:hypothetical protein